MPEAVWSAVVLAAGKGTRMKSSVSKVMHRLLGKPLIGYVTDLLSECRLMDSSIFVVGHRRDDVLEYLRHFSVRTVVQKEQLGTGHAVLCAREALEGFEGHVLILCGDTPLLDCDTVVSFMDSHLSSGNTLSVLTARLENPAGYGRVVRAADDTDRLVRIVEEKDASSDERGIDEINTGIYAARAGFLFDALESIVPDNAQKEYYLTDIVEIAVSRDAAAGAVCCSAAEEVMGVNSRIDLSTAEGILLSRLRNNWMDKGVTFELAETCYIEPDVALGRDVVVGPHVVLKGKTEIGEGCSIGAFSFLDNALIAPGVSVPPFAEIIGRGRDTRG